MDVTDPHSTVSAPTAAVKQYNKNGQVVNAGVSSRQNQMQSQVSYVNNENINNVALENNSVSNVKSSGALEPVAVDTTSNSNVAVSSSAKNVSAADRYQVVKGDTLYSIAFRYGLDYRDLAKKNGIEPPYNIAVGQILALNLSSAKAPEYVVKKGDTLYSIAKANGQSVDFLAGVNDLTPPYTLEVGQKLSLARHNGNSATVAKVENTVPVAGEKEVKASTSTLNKFHLYTAFYMLKMDVYNSLEYNYLQVPLLFPIQTVSNVKFTKSLGVGPFTLQNTATLSHCDTVFVVFPWDTNSRTCFTNPEITCQLNINGKYYPRERVSTIDDPRFINMVFDSLNINNNTLVSVSKDVIDSLNIYQNYTEADITSNCFSYCRIPYFNDNSNFFIGVPLSTDEDFMGGISSNGQTVQIELVGERTSRNPNINSEDWTQAPELIFLEDKILKIYSMKPAGRKQIDITPATLEQIAAGAL